MTLLGDKGVFVRSSTNAEDLPGFNGAGLYDTVPNVKGTEALAAALKTVWGSLWNDRAFAARERAGIDHRAVLAAVLVQTGIDAEAAGVMTTVDPFDEQSAEKRVFIAAKRGIGIRVVEGKKIAEQLIYRPELDSIQMLTRSQDDVMLQFSPDGGVSEVKIEPDRKVLADDLVRRLGIIGLNIQDRFGNRPQDVEWLVVGGQIMIVQSRDYVRGN
jgi:phosphoenolpyruvate synthase/pyruvate phosphate dikinase